MKQALQNRRKSYEDILQKMSNQENTVIRCFNMGLKNWYEIEKHTKMNHDSVKRTISNLAADFLNGKKNEKKILVEIGSSPNLETKKLITDYRLMTEQEWDNWHNGQQTLF